jgi:hypothetical protein
MSGYRLWSARQILPDLQHRQNNTTSTANYADNLGSNRENRDPRRVKPSRHGCRGCHEVSESWHFVSERMPYLCPSKKTGSLAENHTWGMSAEHSQPASVVSVNARFDVNTKKPGGRRSTMTRLAGS